MAQPPPSTMSQISDMANTPPIIHKINPKDYGNILDVGEKLKDNNWTEWRELFMHAINLFLGGLSLLLGSLKRPDPIQFPAEAEIWEVNKKWLGFFIVWNIKSTQHIHIKRLKDTHSMWVALQAIHEPKGYLMVISIQWMLFYTRADKNNDLIEHTNKPKTYWEQINAFDRLEYNVSNISFKGIITGSLPPSWDTFTTPYTNQYKNMGSNVKGETLTPKPI